MKKIWKKYLAFVVLITFIGVFPLHYRFTRCGLADFVSPRCFEHENHCRIHM